MDADTFRRAQERYDAMDWLGELAQRLECKLAFGLFDSEECYLNRDQQQAVRFTLAVVIKELRACNRAMLKAREQ